MEIGSKYKKTLRELIEYVSSKNSIPTGKIVTVTESMSPIGTCYYNRCHEKDRPVDLGIEITDRKKRSRSTFYLHKSCVKEAKEQE